MPRACTKEMDSHRRAPFPPKARTPFTMSRAQELASLIRDLTCADFHPGHGDQPAEQQAEHMTASEQPSPTSASSSFLREGGHPHMTSLVAETLMAAARAAMGGAPLFTVNIGRGDGVRFQESC